jgi:hypothetical protein
MAINVYLIVHHSYDVGSLRRLEWTYMSVITTVTFIPAFVFLFINTEENGPMYGSVTVSALLTRPALLSALDDMADTQSS